MSFEKEIMNRIQNMAIYFVKYARYVNQLKLDKLFFFADYAFCKEYGTSISEQPYVARERGPVPVSSENKESLFYAYQLGQVIVPDELGFYSVAPDKKFDENVFAIKQLECLKKVVENFYDSSGEDMSNRTHEEGGVWHKVWQDGAGENNEIDLCFGIEGDVAKRHALFRKRLELSRKAFSELGV